MRNLQALSLLLVSHEAELYWLSATLSSLFFCRKRWDEQDIADLKLNLLCRVGGHNHFGANEATIFKVSKEPRIKRIAQIGLSMKIRPSRDLTNLFRLKHLLPECGWRGFDARPNCGVGKSLE